MDSCSKRTSICPKFFSNSSFVDREIDSNSQATSRSSSVEIKEAGEETSPPFTFNSAFVGARAGIPQGYQFVVDPAQVGRRWGANSVVLKGEGHVTLTGDGYVFYYPLIKKEMEQLAGKNVSFEVDVRSNIPGAYIQYWDHPNPVKTQSASYDGKGEWNTLKFNLLKTFQRFHLTSRLTNSSL